MALSVVVNFVHLLATVVWIDGMVIMDFVALPLHAVASFASIQHRMCRGTGSDDPTRHPVSRRTVVAPRLLQISQRSEPLD